MLAFFFIQSRADEIKQDVYNVGRCHQDAERNSGFQVNHKLLGQPDIHQLDGEIPTTEKFIHEKGGILWSQYDSEQQFLKTKRQRGEHQNGGQNLDQTAAQILQMIPKRLVLRRIGHLLCRFSVLFEIFSVLLVHIVLAVHTILERAHPFSETFHQFGDLLAAEQQQHNKGDNNDFCHSDSHNFDFLAIGC